MRYIKLILVIFVSANCFAQKNIIGTYGVGSAWPKLSITFNADSTFEYSSTENPVFFRWENFSEKGKWTLTGDTVILNPQLTKKPFVETHFTAQRDNSDTALLLTFNHIKRYFDSNGNLFKADTFQVVRLDYSFNEINKKNTTRVATHRTVRCAFAGYIPKENITHSRTIVIQKPATPLKRIYIGCYELQGTRAFEINDSDVNHLTLDIYSNYYQEGQIRQMKMLLKKDSILFTKQKENGEFEKNAFKAGSFLKIKKQKRDNDLAK